MDESLPTAGEGKTTAVPKMSSSAHTAVATSSIASHTPTTTIVGPTAMPSVNNSSAAATAKSLKRCLSVPIIHPLPSVAMTTRSAAAAAALAKTVLCQGEQCGAEQRQETPKKYQTATPDSSSASTGHLMCGFGSSIHIGIPRSNPSSREVSPAPVFNIFTPRARRYSASYSPLGGGALAASANSGGAALCLTPRVSQLRQEECVDMNSREVNHEREVHSAIQMSQSWEDLTLVAENWSCKSDEFSNPLQVVLPAAGVSSCSSPSPTSNRAGLRLPYGLSPSPTRRTFATRRSMSPIPMRPSQLGPVKRKFELDDNSSNWNVYSQPPMKKIFTESRGSSPICQSPSSVCPSPDSGTYDGRITPKLFISKLCTAQSSSACSSPLSASPNCSSVLGGGAIDSTATSGVCSSSSSSSSSSISSVCSSSEPMCIGSSQLDEGISIIEEKAAIVTPTLMGQPMSTEDEATLMDDMKSETSSIGGCSSISIESSSCDSGAKSAANFFNKLHMDDGGVSTTSLPGSSLGQKNFFINKQGRSGAKKYIVNHDNLPNSSSETPLVAGVEHSINVSSTTTTTTTGMKTRRSNVRYAAAAAAAGTAGNVVGNAAAEAVATAAKALLAESKM